MFYIKCMLKSASTFRADAILNRQRCGGLVARVGSIVLMMGTSSCLAGTGVDLPIDRNGAVAALQDAAGRLDVPLSLKPVGCGSSGDNCRFSAGAGVFAVVTTMGGPRVYQLEASWSNNTKESDASSRVRYASLCAAIVAAVEPTWSKNAVERVASKLTIFRPIKGDSLDVDDRRGAIHFYGAKNVPNMRDFPAEAFLQCGAVPNVE